MVVVQGTDVSVLQGAVPYPALKALGHEFSFIRCKVGNNAGIDVRYAENIRKCLDAGLFGTPYVFPFPLPHLDPVEQAKVFAQSALVGAHLVGSETGDLPPAYDLEWPPPEEWAKWGCTPDSIVDHALAALEQMTLDWSCAPIVYSYPYFLAAISKAKNFAQLMKYRLWIAGGPQYQNGNGKVPVRSEDGTWKDKPPIVPGWGDDWLFWQHDGNGGKRLPGGADADFNVFRFDLIDLARLAKSITDEPLPEMMIPDINTIHAMAANVMADDALHAYRQERIARMFADVPAAA